MAFSTAQIHGLGASSSRTVFFGKKRGLSCGYPTATFLNLRNNLLGMVDTKNEDRLVSQITKRQAVVIPPNTFFSDERFMGKKMSEVDDGENFEIVQKFGQRRTTGDKGVEAALHQSVSYEVLTPEHLVTQPVGGGFLRAQKVCLVGMSELKGVVQLDQPG